MLNYSSFPVGRVTWVNSHSFLSERLRKHVLSTAAGLSLWGPDSSLRQEILG